LQTPIITAYRNSPPYTSRGESHSPVRRATVRRGESHSHFYSNRIRIFFIQIAFPFSSFESHSPFCIQIAFEFYPNLNRANAIRPYAAAEAFNKDVVAYAVENLVPFYFIWAPGRAASGSAVATVLYISLVCMCTCFKRGRAYV
jgi:hypothetical protein